VKLITSHFSLLDGHMIGNITDNIIPACRESFIFPLNRGGLRGLFQKDSCPRVAFAPANQQRLVGDPTRPNDRKITGSLLR
jgi:hypothetical protein